MERIRWEIASSLAPMVLGLVALVILWNVMGDLAEMIRREFAGMFARVLTAR